LDYFSATKLVGLLHVLIARLPQGFLGVGIQCAIGFRVALHGQIKQFPDIWHGLAFSSMPEHRREDKRNCERTDERAGGEMQFRVTHGPILLEVKPPNR